MVVSETDLLNLILPSSWPRGQLEAEARRIYFQDLVANPPQTPNHRCMESRRFIITNTEGAFKKIFGESEGWASYHHRKTGDLDPERLRRAPWIRPILELQVPKTKIYANNHSMGPREFGPKACSEKKRLFITTGKEVLYFISLKFIPDSLVLTTAFAPDGEWLRKTLRAHGTTFLGP
jgi:hypothetical protein